MRIKVDDTRIVEAYKVNAITCGTVETNINTYKYMTAILEVKTNDDPKDKVVLFGEFDVDDCHTHASAKAKIQKFFDDLLIRGYIDISTVEKRKEYGITIY